ncbi:MAG: gliding motility-associated C-terminal domain-containing protein [Bacteroidetes bacterium]|nr:gliding motility-associated C-terminal domain-containing protein [Bacteroidota bacterium]
MKAAAYVCVFFLLILHGSVQAQYMLSPQLIGSTGAWSTSGNYSLSASSGEVIISTSSASGYILTQGFQQPTGSLVALSGSVASTNTSCAGINNGSARAVPQGGNPPYTYAWSNGATTQQILSLAPATYYVTITDVIGLVYTDSAVVDALPGPCELVFYSGITPNGDGKNDFWAIEFIDQYPENNVTIFNRWGEKVFETANYNNADRRWEGNDASGSVLPPATYFYLVEVNGKSFKGWIELTR